jgi:DNA-directed RNA polymerase specialized sigma subunit
MTDSIEQTYEKQALSIELITQERIAELSLTIKDLGNSQRDMAICEMVHGNMRLVLRLTNKYKKMPDYQDTLFDGNLGLIKAILSYDPEKGMFSTWATHKIVTEVRDGILSRLNSPLSISRYGTDMAFRIKNIVPDKDGNVSVPDVPVAKMAMIGIMDGIPMQNENGEYIEVEDKTVKTALEEVQIKDLIEIVNGITQELNMTEDDIQLVAESCSKSIKDSFVPALAKRLGVKPSNLRMRRAKLLWQIRRKLYEKIGKEEYLFLSALDNLPGTDWR